MANLRDRWSQRWPSHIAEKFVPTSFWTLDAKGNYFLDIHLPGFKHEEVRIEPASAGHIKIEGERIVNENKCIYIDHTFPLPENSDTKNIVGKFEGDHLHITVPKIIVEENKEEGSENIGNGNSTNAEESSQEEEEEESNNNGENQTKHEQGHGAAIWKGHVGNKKGMSRDQSCRVASFPEKMIKKWEENDSPLEITIKCLTRNKGVVLSVVISFSIGVWVSKLWM
ncbi:hypothetical protein CRYUN_Cryun13aG0040400 [Craigia yunnanensis]